MAKVKEEHGEKGLGLAHVYNVGMTACADFGRPRETLRLFDEASFSFSRRTQKRKKEKEKLRRNK